MSRLAVLLLAVLVLAVMGVAITMLAAPPRDNVRRRRASSSVDTTVPAKRPARRLPGRTAVLASAGLAVMLLVLGLGSIGVVHGLWSSNLKVAGSVETGDLNADWDKIETHDRCTQGETAAITRLANGVTTQTNTYGGSYGDSDHGTDNPCPPNPCPGGDTYHVTTGGSGDPCPPNPCPEPDTYHVTTGGSDNPCPPDLCPKTDTSHVTTLGGTTGGDDHCVKPPRCEAMIGGIDSDGQFGNQVAYVNIQDATPGYWCKIKAWVSNTGTVPFNIIGIHDILDAKSGDGLSFYDLNGSKPGTCNLVDEHDNTRTDPQVDPGEEAIVYCKVLIDQSEKVCKKWEYNQCKEWTYSGGAKYGWTYHFAVEVCVAQWNEDPSTGDANSDFSACKNPLVGTHEGPDTPVLPTPGPKP